MNETLQATSVDDLSSSFKCSIERVSIDDLQTAKLNEATGKNRKSIIALYTRAINAKMKGKKTI